MMNNEWIHQEIGMHKITASNYGKQKLTESKEVKDKFLITVSSVRHKLGRARYLFNVVEILRPTFHSTLYGKTLNAVSHY